jgi:hypothetical protein
MKEALDAAWEGVEGLSGAAYRSPKVAVGLAQTCTFLSLTRTRCVDGRLTTKDLLAGLWGRLCKRP